MDIRTYSYTSEIILLYTCVESFAAWRFYAKDGFSFPHTDMLFVFSQQVKSNATGSPTVPAQTSRLALAKLGGKGWGCDEVCCWVHPEYANAIKIITCHSPCTLCSNLQSSTAVAWLRKQTHDAPVNLQSFSSPRLVLILWEMRKQAGKVVSRQCFSPCTFQTTPGVP